MAYARSLGARAHGKHFRFTLTTNGVLIDDDVTTSANREMDNVVLSSGRTEGDPRPASAWITPATEAITASSLTSRSWCKSPATKSYYMRGTFTHATRTSPDLFHMADLGFRDR